MALRLLRKLPALLFNNTEGAEVKKTTDSHPATQHSPSQTGTSQPCLSTTVRLQGGGGGELGGKKGEKEEEEEEREDEGLRRRRGRKRKSGKAQSSVMFL